MPVCASGLLSRSVAVMAVESPVWGHHRCEQEMSIISSPLHCLLATVLTVGWGLGGRNPSLSAQAD